MDYVTSLINTRLQDVADAIDAGGAAGNLKMSDSLGNLLATLNFQFPSGAVGGGILTFTNIVGTASSSGTPVSAAAYDSTGSTVLSGLTVGVSTDKNIVLSSVPIANGQTVSISGTIVGH